VPTRGSHIWKTKESKGVIVHGVEDKRQVTIIVSSTTHGINSFVFPNHLLRDYKL